MDYLHEIREFHAANVAPYTGEPCGCRDAEIDALEKRLGFMLPSAYVEFLLWMGNDTDGMFRGNDCFLDDLDRNTQELPSLLKENGVQFQLPARFLAFFSHQGYYMAWFAMPAEPTTPIAGNMVKGPLRSRTGQGASRNG